MALLIRGGGLQVGGFGLSCFNDLVLQAEATLLFRGESVLCLSSCKAFCLFGLELHAKRVEEDLGV